MLLANVIAMLFQALSAKLGIVTGRNLAEMCREEFPQPVVSAMWIISEIAAMATDLAGTQQSNSCGERRFLEVFRSDRFRDVSLSDWLTHTPPAMVAATFNTDESTIAKFPKDKPEISPG